MGVTAHAFSNKMILVLAAQTVALIAAAEHLARGNRPLSRLDGLFTLDSPGAMSWDQIVLIFYFSNTRSASFSFHQPREKNHDALFRTYHT